MRVSGTVLIIIMIEIFSYLQPDKAEQVDSTFYQALLTLWYVLLAPFASSIRTLLTPSCQGGYGIFLTFLLSNKPNG